MHGRGKSDSSVVPGKSPNKAGPSAAAEAMAGRPRREGGWPRGTRTNSTPTGLSAGVGRPADSNACGDLAELCARRIIRSAPHGLEPYHDKIREEVLAGLAPAALRAAQTCDCDPTLWLNLIAEPPLSRPGPGWALCARSPHGRGAVGPRAARQRPEGDRQGGASCEARSMDFGYYLSTKRPASGGRRPEWTWPGAGWLLPECPPPPLEFPILLTSAHWTKWRGSSR